VRHLAETGTLTGERGAYRMARYSAPIDVPVPVQGVLAARIDHLQPDDKRLLQTAAVVGKDVAFGILPQLVRSSAQRPLQLERECHRAVGREGTAEKAPRRSPTEASRVADGLARTTLFSDDGGPTAPAQAQRVRFNGCGKSQTGVHNPTVTNTSELS
jgi:hypothetical protein